MKRKLALILSLAVLMLTAMSVYATDLTPEELAFQDALALYSNSISNAEPDPLADPPPPTPEELKVQAVAAFNDFITTYTDSTVRPLAQSYIGKCYRDHNDSANAKAEYQKVIDNYPASDLVDDAMYQIAFIDFTAGDYEAALTGFTDLITVYETNTDEALNHQVPFAYFMVGECYRKMNDMTSARAKWNELITKFPTHSQAGRANKRLSP